MDTSKIPPRDHSVCDLDVQADIQNVPSTSSSSVMLKQDLLTFQDSTVSYSGDSLGPPPAMTTVDQTEASNLDDFFSRPVRIANFTWLESDPIGTTRVFQPWSLFFTDPRVQYKLNNFAFLQCTLKVKIMINASPFYYGSMLCAYRPLTNFNNDTISVDTGTRYFIPYSQRPCCWLAPQRNEGAEMKLPFLYGANWLPAGTKSEFDNFGSLTFINYTLLQSANGVSGSGVTVSVYAWAEDVRLSGPTLGLATQCDEIVQGDEYGIGPVSRPASAIASFAGSLSRVPVIGKFATATQIGASAVSRVASMFGYTNVPVIANTAPLRPEPFPKFASSEIGFPVEKLTLDPKNELTLDNTVAGAAGHDELAIAKIVQRESYLCSTQWSTSNVADDILFSTPVSPSNFWDITTETYPRVYLTPQAWASSLFQNWRGDVIVRFRIVASKYHKGRLRVSFDPSGQTATNIINTAASNNVIFTEIIDLDGEAEVEFRVPYQQAYNFLANKSLLTPPTWSVSGTPSFVYDPYLYNGTLTLRVLTALTSPVASSYVNVLVFVRGADNLEFANPTGPPNGFSQFAVQSDVITTPAVSSTLGSNSVGDDNLYLVNFGEKIHSLRQVLRRMSLVSVDTPDSVVGFDFYLMKKYFTRIPPFFGYDPNGIHTANGLAAPTSTFKFNFVQQHPINWILTAFVGYRGSVNWTFNVDAGVPVENIRVMRLNQGSYPKSTVATSVIATGSNLSTASVGAAFFAFNAEPGAAGMSLTNQLTNAGMNVQCPMYTRFKFAGTSANRATGPNTGDEEQVDMFGLEYSTDLNGAKAVPPAQVWAYAGIGTDFNVLYFLNVPTMTYIGTAMVPV